METKTAGPNIAEDSMAAVKALDLGIESRECVIPEPSDPCTISTKGCSA
jgi:hypothetical protein